MIASAGPTRTLTLSSALPPILRAVLDIGLRPTTNLISHSHLLPHAWSYPAHEKTRPALKPVCRLVLTARRTGFNTWCCFLSIGSHTIWRRSAIGKPRGL